MSLEQVAAFVPLVLEPLLFALEVEGAAARLVSYGAPAFGVAAVRAAITVLGVTAGRLVWHGDPQGWALMRWWALLSMGGVALTFGTPYFPSNRTPADKEIWLAGWVTIYALWFVLAQWRVRSRNKPAAPSE